MGKGSSATLWAVPYLLKAKHAVLSSGTPCVPQETCFTLPYWHVSHTTCLHPSLGSRRARGQGLSVLHTNSLATSIAHFHDSVMGCRERFTEGTIPGKSLEKVYVEKVPF